MRTVSTDDEPGADLVNSPIGVANEEPPGCEVDLRDSPPEPDVGAGPPPEVDQGWVETRAVEPDRGPAACLGAVRQPECDAARRLDTHGRDGACDRGECVEIESRALERGRRRWRGEDSPSVPGPGRGPLEDRDGDPGSREARSEDRPSRATADDRDIDPLAGHSPAPRWSSIVGSSAGGGGAPGGGAHFLRAGSP